MPDAGRHVAKAKGKSNSNSNRLRLSAARRTEASDDDDATTSDEPKHPPHAHAPSCGNGGFYKKCDGDRSPGSGAARVRVRGLWRCEALATCAHWHATC